MTEWLLRFVIGGVVVSLFSALGEVWHPKRFAGIFSAAPSVGLGTLALTFSSEGPSYVLTECKAMIPGSVAFLCYAAVCVWVAQRKGSPVWLGAAAAWLVWLLVAGVTFWLSRGILELA